MSTNQNGFPILLDVREYVHNYLIVADLTENGSWRTEFLQNSLPADIIHRLHAIPPPRAELEDDSPTWADGADGEFHMKMMSSKNPMFPLEVYPWQAAN
ncbi:hypothetical protein SESBI_40463 [Sesbania bispinosa]|nr:hypothetical protein SESBI_40463 [Sesbania bispinosa]